MTPSVVRFIDLFCGVGGFRLGMEEACRARGDLAAECALSSDIDPHCQAMYEANFGHRPFGDISALSENDIPAHDLLLAGFPCQPFSIIGQMKGFQDTRGTLFFDIARILSAARPRAFVLENVKQLAGHDGGRTLATIQTTLEGLGYRVWRAVLNALDYGLPQKRERIFIVGSRVFDDFAFPPPRRPYKSLDEILEREVAAKYYASEHIRNRRKAAHQSAHYPAVWHENKSGNISSYPYSCALRAGASYNYLLVNGERRLTPREMFRLQGFPDSYKIVVGDVHARKQAGNAVPVNLVAAVVGEALARLYP